MAAPAAASVPSITVGEYLGSVYRPDVDYVDGNLEERNVGEIDHATVQKMILLALTEFEDLAGVYAIQETRVQVHATRFRVPDVTLIATEHVPPGSLRKHRCSAWRYCLHETPSWTMRQRCMDYIRTGVPEVWIFDLETETAYVLCGDEFFQASGEILHLGTCDIILNIPEVYAAARRRLRRQ